MRFALLGPLAVTDGTGSGVALAGPRQRVLLAALLLHANVPVRAEALAEMVWDGSPPPAAGVTLRSYVRRLRRALGPEAAVKIVARDPGYLIGVGEPELDVLEFEALCRDAGAALRAREWADAAAAAGRASGLWRAAPLLDVPAQVLRDEFVPRLELLRLQVLEDGFEAGLRLGQHRELIPQLQDLTARHPLRERFHAQLMLALAGTGRQAEALEAYQKARLVLADELGTEPGTELRSLHQQLLAGDVALAIPVPMSAGHAPAQPAPTGQLPGMAVNFTGRAAELAVLDGMLEEASEQRPGTMVISAIGGTAGVGKTALAVHWTHRVAHRFPGGQLYANLRGFDPSGTPVTPGEAIRGFLEALGVPVGRIPRDLAAQARLYRSLVTGRRLLIVLDNARDEQQVRPLLPAGPQCMVVVTSRRQLAGLAAADGARLLSLDLLSDAEARQMLSARTGAARAAAEPDAVAEIARLCARLPLALAVAAARASTRPGLPLSGLAAELRNVQGRLDVLDTGDPAASVRAVFSWSAERLTPDAARMFRLLGLHPGPDITASAAASLAGAGEPQARRLLAELTRAHLLTERVPGRYAFHDLLRAYATEQACATDSDADRHAAVGRALDHYLHTAHAAALLIDSTREAIPVPPPRPGVRAEYLAGYQQALAWMQAEHQVLLAAITLADSIGADIHAWQIPWTMFDFLRRRGHWHQDAAVQRTAVAAATRLGDPGGQALSLRLLSQACASLGDYDQALARCVDSLKLCQQLGDRVGEAKAHQFLAAAANGQGRYADGLSHYEQALRLHRAVGHRTGEACVLNNVGWAHALLGDFQQARGFCQQSLTLAAELGMRHVECHAWDSLGYAEHHLGNLAQAAACYQRALSMFREAGDLPAEAETLTHLGDTRHAAGELPQARDAWQQARDILDQLHHPDAGKVRAKLASADGQRPASP